MRLKLMILFDKNNHEEAQLLDLIIELNSKQSKSEIELSSERRDIGSYKLSSIKVAYQIVLSISGQPLRFFY